MCPVLSLGGIEVHAYALFTWLGAVAACAIAIPALMRRGWTLFHALVLMMTMCAGFLIGARLWNVMVNPGNFLLMPWYALKLAGLSLYGGLFGVVLVLLAYAKAAGKSVLSAMDALTVPGGVAFCLARIGCFLNGCCSGTWTKGPFGIVFPKEHVTSSLPSLLSFIGSEPVHPTQLYELVGAAAGLLAVVLLTRKYRRMDGVLFFSYAAVFSLVRLIVLPMRVLTYMPSVKNIVYPVIYSCIILVSAVGIRLLTRQNRVGIRRDCGHTGTI